MRVEVLTVPDCPHGPAARRNLAEALAGRPGVSIERRVVSTAEEAARYGMHGSPTILIDGRDAFAGPGTAASLACRLYRDADGPGSGRAVSRAAARGGDRRGVLGRLCGTRRGAARRRRLRAGCGPAMMTVYELAGTWAPYVTMSEALRVAAQALRRDVTRLSCCAA